MSDKFRAHLDILHQERKTHGQSRTYEYSAWAQMMQRCHNPRSPNYPRYGAVGRVVCPRWHTAEHFLNDMGPKPSSAHSLERRDNALGYSPENCYWATKAEQSRNRTGIRLFDFQGQRLCLTDIARLSGIPVMTLKYRMKRCTSVDEAIHAYPYRRQPSHHHAI